MNKQATIFSLRTKLILAFSLLVTLGVAVTAYFYYITLRNQALQSFRQRISTAVAIAALQQNGDEFASIVSAGDYYYEKFRLQNLKIRGSDSQFIYVYTLSKDENGLYFVVDAGEPGEENISAFGDRYETASETLMRNYDTMSTVVTEPDIYTDVYGSFLSAYAPIVTSDGKKVGVIGIDIDAATIEAQRSQLLRQTLTVSGLAILAGIAAGYILGNLLVRPINKLTKTTRQYASGDFSARSEVKTNDEVGEFSRTLNQMASEIQILLTGLEERVQDRTKELEAASEQTRRRADQFQAIARVSRTISSVQNLDELLPRITRMISQEFGFYHTGIFLLDSQNAYAVLRAANSEGGQRMLARSHRLKVGEEGIVGYVTAAGQARIALDTGDDAVFFSNPDLPNTRSEMTLPLKTGDKVIGALDVQSTEPEAFDQQDINILSALADQVSVAIQNARLYEETQQALNNSENLYRQFIQQEWLQQIESGSIVGVAHNGTNISLLKEAVELPESQNVLRTGEIYQKSASAADRYSTLAIPVKLHNQTIGAVSVRAPGNRAWRQDEIDIVATIVERAALAMENARLIEDAQQRASQERTISNITSKITSTTRIESILRTATEEIGHILQGSEVLVQIQSLKETN